MIHRPRQRRGATLSAFAGLMMIAWLAMVFVARSLAGSEQTAGFAAFVGFLVICLSTVVYVLFMMAVDSDKA